MKKMAIILVSMVSLLIAEEYSLHSPDGQTRMKINVDDQINYSLFHKSKTVLESSRLALKLGAQHLGVNPEIKEVEKNTSNSVLHPVVQVKNKTVLDNYKE